MVRKAIIPKGYKQTEVGVIPEDWDIRTLEEICVEGGMVRGPFGGALKKEFFVKSGIKVYEQKNAIYRNIEIGSYYVDDVKFYELKRFEVNERDFIVSCSGTIGRIYQIPEGAPKGIINQALLKIKTDDSIINEKYFLYYFDWERFQEKIIDNTQGGAMKNLVGMDIFRNTPIPIPPTIEEQQAIAEALLDVDGLIASLDHLITKKLNIKQGTMQQLLTGKERLPGFSGESDSFLLGDLEKQGKVKLGRGDVISKKDIESNHGEFPIYSSSIHNKGLFGAYGKYMFDEELITWSIDGGGNFFYRRKHKFSVTNVCGFMRLDKRIFNYKYLAMQLEVLHKSQTFDYTMKAHPSEIRKLYMITIPSLEEQTSIAEVLSDMDAEIEALEQKRDKYKSIKQGMMQELLTGRTRLV